MTDAATYIDQQKKAQLDALAAGGTRALQEYQQAQAAIGAQQKGSIDAALAESQTRGASPEMQAEIERIIGQGSAPRLAEMGKRSDLTAYLGGHRQFAEGTYMDALKGTLPALEAELAASGGGGGSGGSGRSSSGDDEEEFWRDLLTDAYGPTDTLRKAGLAWDAEQLIEGTDAPRASGVQALADEYGIPQFAIEDMFPGTRFMRLGNEQIDVEQQRGGTVKDFKRVLRGAASDKKEWPGSQANMRRALVQQARQVLPKGKKKRKK